MSAAGRYSLAEDDALVTITNGPRSGLTVPLWDVDPGELGGMPSPAMSPAQHSPRDTGPMPQSGVLAQPGGQHAPRDAGGATWSVSEPPWPWAGMEMGPGQRPGYGPVPLGKGMGYLPTSATERISGASGGGPYVFYGNPSLGQWSGSDSGVPGELVSHDEWDRMQRARSGEEAARFDAQHSEARSRNGPMWMRRKMPVNQVGPPPWEWFGDHHGQQWSAPVKEAYHLLSQSYESLYRAPGDTPAYWVAAYMLSRKDMLRDLAVVAAIRTTQRPGGPRRN